MGTMQVATIAMAVVLATATAQVVKDAMAAPESRKNYDGAQMLRVFTPTTYLKEKVIQLGYEEDLRMQVGAKDVDLFVEADKVAEVKETLDLMEMMYTTIIDNLQQAFDTENTPLSHGELKLFRKTGHRMTWHRYHGMDDIYGYLDYLAQTYPYIVSVHTIGFSVEGRPLKIAKISSGWPNNKALWIDGGIHAREWITPASVTYIISQLVENRDNQADIVKGVDFYILPVVNPDGYEYSLTTDRLWRKNRAPHGSCVGTDLNRNWGFKWGGAGSSKDPCDKECFAGFRAFSEPETKAISNFIFANKVNIKGYLTFHSYGPYILYPWGFDLKVPPDYMNLQRVGKAMANAMQKVGSHAYTVGPSASTIYPASGSSHDWAKGVAGIKYTYTIELPGKGDDGFFPPFHYIQPIAKEALAAVRVLAQEVRNTP